MSSLAPPSQALVTLAAFAREHAVSMNSVISFWRDVLWDMRREVESDKKAEGCVVEAWAQKFELLISVTEDGNDRLLTELRAAGWLKPI